MSGRASKLVCLFSALVAAAGLRAQAPDRFTFMPPGQLQGVGEKGLADSHVYFPAIIFPVAFQSAKERVILNSQMYGYGGSCAKLPCFTGTSEQVGSYSDPRNFAYPWRDTFCEHAGRGGRRNPECTSDPRSPHQGVDIRPPSTVPGRYSALAVTDATIMVATGARVEMMGSNGVKFIYRHLLPSSITHWTVGAKVRRGDVVGKIANIQKPATATAKAVTTSTHLHLEAFWRRGTGELRPWPLYASLIRAYGAAIGQPIALNRNGDLVGGAERASSMPVVASKEQPRALQPGRSAFQGIPSVSLGRWQRWIYPKNADDPPSYDRYTPPHYVVTSSSAWYRGMRLPDVEVQLQVECQRTLEINAVFSSAEGWSQYEELADQRGGLTWTVGEESIFVEDMYFGEDSQGSFYLNQNTPHIEKDGSVRTESGGDIQVAALVALMLRGSDYLVLETPDKFKVYFSLRGFRELMSPYQEYCQPPFRPQIAFSRATM